MFVKTMVLEGSGGATIEISIFTCVYIAEIFKNLLFKNHCFRNVQINFDASLVVQNDYNIITRGMDKWNKNSCVYIKKKSTQEPLSQKTSNSHESFQTQYQGRGCQKGAQ
jgi:hypothetical protein